MRELKFRAWDKEGKKMIDVQCISNWSADEAVDDYFEAPQQVQNHTGNWFSSVELMQYTGLHDKNGKEIYEGDLVKYGTDTPKEIVFDESAWRLGKWRHCNDVSLAEYIDEPFEVISNIYENPELVGGDKLEKQLKK